MASERYFEILVSLAPDLIFGPNYKVIAQQLTLPSGRLDLLLEDDRGHKHIVEIKKDVAKPDAVKQVVRYVRDYREVYSGVVFGWVVANKISDAALALAATESIRTLGVPEMEYMSILAKKGIHEDMLFGDRIQPGVLIGGGVQSFNSAILDFGIVAARLPEATGRYLQELLLRNGVSMSHGKLQTAIIYKGVKIGGVNSLHFFVSTNIVTDEKDEVVLQGSGFVRRQKTQASSSHMHVYWTLKPTKVELADQVISHFIRKIDRILFSVGE